MDATMAKNIDLLYMCIYMLVRKKIFNCGCLFKSMDKYEQNVLLKKLFWAAVLVTITKNLSNAVWGVSGNENLELLEERSDDHLAYSKVNHGYVRELFFIGTKVFYHYSYYIQNVCIYLFILISCIFSQGM